jgi:hypothetical protein
VRSDRNPSHSSSIGSVARAPQLRRAAVLLGLGLLAACKSTPPVAPSSASSAPPPLAAPLADPDPDSGPSDHMPGRPDLKICKKEWTAAECCEFLCRCLGKICGDSAKGGPGIATCGSWCPALSDKARRCHVYHCYVSISPTGGMKDHDSHCGHAADQLPGGGCPAAVYE